jgi:hypothetical protein
MGLTVPQAAPSRLCLPQLDCVWIITCVFCNDVLAFVCSLYELIDQCGKR